MTNTSRAGKRREPDQMLRGIFVTAAGLAILYIGVMISGKSAPWIGEASWFVPMVGIFIALTSLSIAMLALGRFQVQHDALSFWVGLAFAIVAIGQVFFILAWPGLLSDGRAFMARLPNTSAVISNLVLTLQSVLLLVAVLSNTPVRRMGRRGLGMAAIWIVFSIAAFTLLFYVEDYLPPLILPDGSYSLYLYGWATILVGVFGIGTIVSIVRYHRTGDRLAGYVAFSQLVILFVVLMILVSVKRYDLWWYIQRLVLIFGNLIVLIGLLRDYVNLFREVQESEGRYQQLTESLPQLVWTCLPDGWCDYLSPQWTAYTGIPAEKQLGHAWLEQIHPDDRERAATLWQAAFKRSEPFGIEFRLRRGDGIYRWFSDRALPIHDPDGGIIHWFGTSTDIQDQKSYAEQLERNNRDLRELGYFTSHGMQEPLRKIEMYADKLLQEEFAKERRPRERLNRLQKSAGQMRSMLTAVFELSRLNLDRPVRQALDLKQVVLQAMTNLKKQIDETKARVEVGELPCLEGDPDQLCELFEQLINNALKFQPRGASPLIKIAATDQKDDYVQLMVRDNGIGFEEGWAERIFEPFQRLVGPGDFDGSGVGLALCRKIVENHHGAISVSSKQGQGTSFFITLPVKQTD
jgi:PAS domain S-box-containing protein